MRLGAAFLAHEWLVQRRSPRFLGIAGLYVLAATAPAVALAAVAPASHRLLGPATYAGEILAFQPLLTFLAALLIAHDCLVRERHEGSWATLAVAPVSNAAYVGWRWLAISALLVPLTVVPLAAGAAIAAAASPVPPAAGHFAWPWLLQVLPACLVGSALGAGLGTVSGNLLVTAIFVTGATAGGSVLVNGILARFHGKLEGPEQWLGLAAIGSRLGMADWIRKGWVDLDAWVTPASDAPYDAGLAWRALVPRWILFAGAAAATLSLAVLLLRRMRRDLRPWRGGAGAASRLPSFARLLGRWREDYSPDAGLVAADRVAAAAGPLLFAAAVCFLLMRAHSFEMLARQRYAAEADFAPPPTPAAVVVERWRVAGEVAASGEVRLRAALQIWNGGPAPQSRLSCVLDPGLRIAGAPAGVRLERRWDRLAVELSPPLAAGARRTLAFTLAGRPAEAAWNLAGGGSFATRFRAFAAGRFAADLSDLSRSLAPPRVSARRVELPPGSLGPILRYAAWGLTPPPAGQGEPGLEVPPESYFPDAEIDLDLALPPGLLLADSCGHLSHTDGGRRRLAGSCRAAPGELAVFGGPQRLLPDSPAGGALAVLPAHLRLAAAKLPFFAAVARLERDAWPGAAAPAREIFLEWPPAFTAGPVAASPFGPPAETAPAIVHGNTILLQESALVDRLAGDPAALAADLTAERLLAHARVAPRDRYLFGQIVANLVQLGLGAGEEQRAVLGKLMGYRYSVHLEEPPWDSVAWPQRLAAVVFTLVHQVGVEPLERTVTTLLARSRQGPPVTVRQLFAAAAALPGGGQAARIYDQFVAGDDVPALRLAAVGARRIGDHWEVNGVVINRGSGVVSCPVMAVTRAGTVTALVDVGGGRQTAFHLSTRAAPRSVVLDPEQTTFRLAESGPAERVELAAAER